MPFVRLNFKASEWNTFKAKVALDGCSIVDWLTFCIRDYKEDDMARRKREMCISALMTQLAQAVTNVDKAVLALGEERDALKTKLESASSLLGFTPAKRGRKSKVQAKAEEPAPVPPVPKMEATKKPKRKAVKTNARVRLTVGEDIPPESDPTEVAEG
jgi:hypothetical protein